MRLSDWQAQVQAYLLNPDAQPNPALQASLLGSAALSAEQGLAIYHNAYRARLLEALRGDYPAVHGWLGDEEFDALALAYLDAHPRSTSACAGSARSWLTLSTGIWCRSRPHRLASWRGWNGPLPWPSMRRKASP